MQRYPILFLSLIVSLITLQPAEAQEAQRFSLNDAIEIALENNYALDQAENNESGAVMQVKSAKADYLPSISTSFSGSKRIGRQFNENTGEVVDATTNGVSGGVSASLNLFSGFQNYNSLKSSQFNAQAQHKNVSRIRETIIFETASRYLDLLVNKELLRIDRQNLEVSRDRLKKIKEQVELGSLPKADLYNQQSTVANNKLALTDSRNAVKMSKIRLLRQMQVNLDRPYEFQAPDISLDSIRITPRSYDLDQLIEVSMESREDLQQQKYQVKSNEHQLDVSRANRYPSLSLSSSFRSSYNDQQRDILRENGTVIGFQDVAFSEQFFNRNINRSVGLNVSIPVFNNYNINNQIQQQKISYKNAQLQLEDQQMQIVQEVTEAYNNYESIIQRLESTREALRAAELAFETQQERYDVGSASFVELNQANANYMEARSNRAQAVYNYLFQKELLNYYIGKMDEDMSLQNMQNSLNP